MSRPSRSERLAARGRPKRRAAAKANIFKYQLAALPSRIEENDLKRALQISLEEQLLDRNVVKSNSKKPGYQQQQQQQQITRASASAVDGPVNKRARLAGHSNEPLQNNKCDSNSTSKVISIGTSSTPPTPPLHINKAIRTYSRSQTNNIDSHPPTKPNNNSKPHQPHHCLEPSSSSSTALLCKPKSTSDSISVLNNGHGTQSKSSSQSSVSKSTQTPSCELTVVDNNSTVTDSPSKNNVSAANTTLITKDNATTTNGVESPVQNQYLKSKRESKNYAYVKMTALKVSTEKSPSSLSKNSSSKRASPSGVFNNRSANKDSSKTTQPKVRDDPMIKDTNTSLNVSNTSKHSDGSKRPQKQEEKSTLKHDSALGKKSTTIVLPKSAANKDCKATSNDTNKLVKGFKGTITPSQGTTPSKVHLDESGIEYDCSTVDTNLDLSTDRDHNQDSVDVIRKRTSQGSWSLLGVPEEKIIYLRDDEPPRRLICYPAIKHVEGDVIQVCAFWEDAETGGVMMSLFWYYRPEHTEDGRKPHHLVDEVFASRHRDVDSVECIEDKCYVLTFSEYCRYRKRCKMEQVNTTWSLTDVTIPMSNESYPRRNRVPDSDVSPELVFCCRQIYDSRMKRLIKNPHTNPKYGHN